MALIVSGWLRSPGERRGSREEQLLLPCWHGLGRLGPVLDIWVCGCRGLVGTLEGADRVLPVTDDGDNSVQPGILMML